MSAASSGSCQYAALSTARASAAKTSPEDERIAAQSPRPRGAANKASTRVTAPSSTVRQGRFRPAGRRRGTVRCAPVSDLRTVLGTREVPTLLSTSMVGRLPTAMATLAVLLLVRGQGGSYTLAGGLAALFTAGSGIGQPMLARLVDRRGQWQVLVLAAAVSTAALVVLALSGAHQPVVSAVAAALAGVATPPIEPCLRSMWAHVVAGGSVLRAAFSLDVGLQELVFVAGPLLTVAAVEVVGRTGGVFACALFGAFGTLGFAATAASRNWRPTPVVEGPHGSPLRHGLLVRVFLVALACGVPVGALAIVAAAFAGRHGDSAITGWALAANAGGALVSGLYGAVRPYAGASARTMTLSGVALAVGYLPLAMPMPVWLWLVAAGVSGLALPVVLGVVFQRVNVVSPPNLVTEANAWVVTAFTVGAATASLLAGIVTDRLQPSTAIAVIVLAGSAFTALVCLTSHRPDH
jgi:MFS family permease